MTTTKASTESANEEKKCLVKSGKVSNPILATVRLYPNDRLPILKRSFAYTQMREPHFGMGVEWV